MRGASNCKHLARRLIKCSPSNRTSISTIAASTLARCSASPDSRSGRACSHRLPVASSCTARRPFNRSSRSVFLKDEECKRSSREPTRRDAAAESSNAATFSQRKCTCLIGHSPSAMRFGSLSIQFTSPNENILRSESTFATVMRCLGNSSNSKPSSLRSSMMPSPTTTLQPSSNSVPRALTNAK